MMRKTSLLFGLLAVVLICGVVASPAGAGFIVGTVEVDLPKGNGNGQGHHGPPAWAKCPDWVFDTQAEKGHLGMEEKFKGHEPLAVMVSGETDDDPVMTVMKSVENDSGVLWTEFEIELSGVGVQFVGTASSSAHFDAADVTPMLVTFSGGPGVADGQTVTFNFDVEISTTGYFSYTMTQTPTPEPATLALLGFGGLGLVVMRRRRVR